VPESIALPVPAAPGPPPTTPSTVESPQATGAALLAQAEAALNDGKTDEALKLVEEALRQGADADQASVLRSRIYEHSGDLEKAHQELESAVQVDPALVEATLRLADLEESRGLWQRAIELCLQAIQHSPGFTASYLRLYELYRQHNQPRRALETLEQGAKSNPGSAPLLLRLGAAYTQRGMLTAAQAALLQAVAVGLNSDKITAYARLGDLYARLGRYGPAFDAYAKSAQASGVGGEVTPESYDKTFAAADWAVSAILDTMWSQLSAFAEDRNTTREEAYAAVSQAVAQVRDVRDFAGKIMAPAGRPEVHAQRELYYQVAYEAAYNGLLYLDTGDPALLKSARERKDQAAVELKAIGGGSR
jgi:tetratricopeptide (TPR) repeat protein